jgi:hypothetical protein
MTRGKELVSLVDIACGGEFLLWIWHPYIFVEKDTSKDTL